MMYEKERRAWMEADLFRRLSPEHPEMGGNRLQSLDTLQNKVLYIRVSTLKLQER